MPALLTRTSTDPSLDSVAASAASTLARFVMSTSTSAADAPIASMLLGDLGADVVRVDRPSPPTADPRAYVMHRGRRSVAVDLKHAEGREVVLRLVETADALIEGHRPGVMERLGLGPDDCLS